jgi:hypothetical protein
MIIALVSNVLVGVGFVENIRFGILMTIFIYK